MQLDQAHAPIMRTDCAVAATPAADATVAAVMYDLPCTYHVIFCIFWINRLWRRRSIPVLDHVRKVCSERLE